jgi:hypothetical protein
MGLWYLHLQAGICLHYWAIFSTGSIFSGSGNHAVRGNLRCSFGYCSMTDLTQGISCVESASTFPILIVCSAVTMRKKLCITFSLAANLQPCWASLHIVWDLSLSVVSMIEQQRSRFGFDCFMEVVILSTWSIWLHRNNIIFNSTQISLNRWCSEFHDIFLLCKHRAKPSLEACLTSWMSSL